MASARGPEGRVPPSAESTYHQHPGSGELVVAAQLDSARLVLFLSALVGVPPLVVRSRLADSLRFICPVRTVKSIVRICFMDGGASLVLEPLSEP